MRACQMSGSTVQYNDITKKIIIGIVVVSVLVFGGWFLSRQNKIDEENKKDPYKILGYTIGEVSGKYCEGANFAYNKFFIQDRVFGCDDIERLFIDSDMNNYILSAYNFSFSNGAGYFNFDIDKTQADLRPLEVDNPEQFVGKMATALCPRYSLADVRIYAAGEHMGISTVDCKDINKYSMDQDVIITDVYYGADEESGDNPDEYYEQNNAKGTRRLYFDGEYMKDRLVH